MLNLPIYHRALSVFALLLILSGCEMFDYSPFDTGVDDSSRRDLTARNMTRLALITPANPHSFSFAFLTDTHSRYDAFLEAIRSINAHPEVLFVVHGGDMTHYGLVKEYLWAANILEQCRAPVFTAIGNHDCLSNGRHIYEQIFGEPSYTFFVHLGDGRRFKFVVCDCNTLEFSSPEENTYALKSWILKSLFDVIPTTGTIVVMHIPPYDTHYFDEALKDFFHRQLTAAGVLFLLHGHHHRFCLTHPHGNGPPFLGGDNIRDRNYCIVTVYTGDTVSFDVNQVFF